MTWGAGKKRIGLILGSVLAFLILLLLALSALDHMSPYDFVRGYAEGRATATEEYKSRPLRPFERGAIIFRYGDFGGLSTDTLETHATPWRLAATALALREVDRNGGDLSLARTREAMRRFGFLYPEAIGNWPQGLEDASTQLDAPLGLSIGQVRRSVPAIQLTAANLSCASCHAGVTYDATGAPVAGTAWLGAPNTSLNLEAYVLELYQAFKTASTDEPRLLDALRKLFPDTTDAEIATISNFVMPRVRDRLAQLAVKGDRPLPFVNGAPGITNGVAALRMQLGTLPADAYETQRGFTSIPELGNRAFRSMLLYDGAYTPAGDSPSRLMKRSDGNAAHKDALAGVASFFTIPSMGVHPDRAEQFVGDARSVFDFLDIYAAPRFPGAVDPQQARVGRDLYAQKCASCHGAYDDSLTRPELAQFPNWIGAYNTDPVRHEAFDPQTIEAVDASRYGNRILARATHQYAAPPLSGLWLSAPYLHNGSVPTLWQLMTPSERPSRFQVGGHALDFREVGIAGAIDASGVYVYSPGYQPWAAPVVLDTTQKGYGNSGHEAEFLGLTDPEKWALIEYLKLL